MTALRPVPAPLDGRFIRLEPLEPQQLPELYDAIGSADVFAGGWGGGPAAHRATQAEFVDFASGYLPWHANPYGIRLVGGDDDGLLVGTSSLMDFDEKREATHLGATAYAPSVWGTAVNPEAKLLLLGLAFDSGFERVRIQADGMNDRSRAAILKLGARFEGIVRHDMRRADDSWRDTALYSILSAEWPGVRAALEARLAKFAAPVQPR
ncbi:GNAT family N-acetyltransferase [Microbacteriaceae bacterium VKM Ac-2855]|nr:GNAT family N-acetyltransferase [Microbacteriaceae bacterium VKM Ac-2855]